MLIMVISSSKTPPMMLPFRICVMVKVFSLSPASMLPPFILVTFIISLLEANAISVSVTMLPPFMVTIFMVSAPSLPKMLPKFMVLILMMSLSVLPLMIPPFIWKPSRPSALISRV